METSEARLLAKVSSYNMVYIECDLQLAVKKEPLYLHLYFSPKTSFETWPAFPLGKPTGDTHGCKKAPGSKILRCLNTWY